MAKAVFLHKADSIYDDEPDSVYDFPKRYLSTVKSCIGDWIIYYEPVKAGDRGYFAVAKVLEVIPKPDHPDRYLAIIARGSFLPFERELPRLRHGQVRESRLGDESGAPVSGGLVQQAVRPISDAEFEAIVADGLPPDLEDWDEREYRGEVIGFEESVAPFSRPVIERLTRRPYRDAAFRRKVRRAYGYRCAISGLELRNGGGRPEVNAAHIRPVASGGNDTVRNGLALSSTLHWMFDRGLIAVEPENYSILISHNKVPSDAVERLIGPKKRLMLPADKANWPHPGYLKWHRENVFGQSDAQYPTE